MSEVKELNELEKAQQLVNEEKQKRCEAFQIEFEEMVKVLCKKYNCNFQVQPVQQVGISITAN